MNIPLLGDFQIPISFSYWILQSIAMGLTALVLPNLRITNPLGALGAVVALAFVNSHIWDAALFFSIPQNFTSHAMTILVANGLLFWLIVKILPGIESDGIFAPIVAPVLFTIFSILISEYGKNVDWLGLISRAVNYITAFKGELISTSPVAGGS